VADAQLSEPVLHTLETVMGCTALLIDSERKPAAGRELVAHDTKGSWRCELVKYWQRRERTWVSTTSQKAISVNSAQDLAVLALQEWPEANVLVVDSETVADPDHAASRLGAAPEEVLANVDVVIASPAVAAGLSVENMPGHFKAVFGFSGGATDVAGAVQALARVRDGCVRHVYAAQESPGKALLCGSGSGKPQELLRHLSQHEARCVSQLLDIGWENGISTVGPWLQLWAQQAALQNRQRCGYREAVLGLLRAEGYEIRFQRTYDEKQAHDINEKLKDIAFDKQQEQHEALINTPLISDEKASALKGARRRLTAAEELQLDRWRVDKDWALAGQPPSFELLEAHRDGQHRRLHWGWQLLNRDARSAAAVEDENEGRRRWGGNYWAPDLCLKLQGPRLAVADLLRLPQWLERAQCGQWFKADHPELEALHGTVADHQGLVAQALGIKPAKRSTTELEQLLGLAGYRLESKRRRCRKGRKASATYYYRVVREDLPQGASLDAMEAQWLARSFDRLFSQKHLATQEEESLAEAMAELAVFVTSDS
jgi:hypothetical protein